VYIIKHCDDNALKLIIVIIMKLKRVVMIIMMMMMIEQTATKMIFCSISQCIFFLEAFDKQIITLNDTDTYFYTLSIHTSSSMTVYSYFSLGHSKLHHLYHV